MKITIRLIVSLLMVVGLVSVVFAMYQTGTEKDRLADELKRRAIVLAESLQESVVPLMQSGFRSRLDRLVERFGNRERLKGVIVLDPQGNIVSSTSEVKSRIKQPFPQAVSSITEKRPVSDFIEIGDAKAYIYAVPLVSNGTVNGSLALLYDASYINIRLLDIWKHNLIRFLVVAILIVAITLLIVRWSITGPIAQFAEWMRELRTGKKGNQPVLAVRGDVLAPLISEAAQLAKTLALARSRAEEEARLRIQADSLWTAHRLREQMRVLLGGKKLYLLSNREPYLHVREGSDVRCVTPAGGLVTALDPVMRICDGVWIAHGSGDADMEVVDQKNSLRVPPGEASYTLRRIWLSKEEEDGYYYGFSNEGLWPLCHITHTRPEFRLNDWICYQEVNEKFALTLLDEIADEKAPLVLIQDYQLALLPLLIKKRKPDARVALFWHIPWPNPEAYGICPWHGEILMGMLGADIIGFHTQYHCNNFLDTVDRFLESKIDWERFCVDRSGHNTLIKPFPISVSFEGAGDKITSSQGRISLRQDLFRSLDMKAEFLGVGVDRIDYTKGIPERLRAIERFFEKHPEFIGRFTYIELGSPSRTHIKRYRELTAEVEEMVEKINWRFKSASWSPIVLLKAHHSHEEIDKFYKASEVCLVTSLHDGMNLVAKEFVVSREDEDGVLVLSQFAGASRELRDALIINPYDIEEMADAIHISLTMVKSERQERMRRMRDVVRDNNIYRWAGNLISSLVRLRPEDAAQDKT